MHLNMSKGVIKAICTVHTSIIWAFSEVRRDNISHKIYSTGCLVMKATQVFAYCKGEKFVLRPKTHGKSSLYIGHFDIP